MTKPITIPNLSLVLMVGASGSGKSTFARRCFKPTEIVSSDAYRAVVSNDETDQSATDDAFEVLQLVVRKRLARGLLTVIDATNVQPRARKPLVELAREYHVLPVAIVLDVPEEVCRARNQARADRSFSGRVVKQQVYELHGSMRKLDKEGFRHVHVLSSVEDADSVTVERQALWNDRRYEHGPFDLIGDVHGCFDELSSLLAKLGYSIAETPGGEQAFSTSHPAGRKAVFLGDLVDRGPRVPDVLRLVMAMVAQATALCVPGNHDVKLMRKLRGKEVRVTHGLAESLAQLENEPPELSNQVASFIDGLVSHYVLDGGKLVVAHAGLKESMQGRGSRAVREFSLYGETTGETDEYGFPVRYPWAADYRGRAAVVYGHTPVHTPEWLNGTICVDTGCVYGGRLTALRWPERELVSVAATKVHYEPARPLTPPTEAPALTPQQEHDELIDLTDVTGKRMIETGVYRTVTLREESSAAALEALSRFAVDPKWLVYVPPTMSPPETSRRDGLLEHPDEAFAYFRKQGVVTVVCEEKHMGSRAVVVVCRDEQAARERFGVTDGRVGVITTRTGRPFFRDESTSAALLDRLRVAIERADLWSTLETTWMVLDAELMPWSLKAQSMIEAQYAAVGAAAESALGASVEVLERALAAGVDIGAIADRTRARRSLSSRYRAAYRPYCWPVRSLDDVKLAPFHVMATEGHVHADKAHDWHLATIGTFADQDPTLLVRTRHRHVDLSDDAAVRSAVAWWEELTGSGGEGIVVKPLSFLTRGPKGLVQPAVKCRGPEYLRIIYGPEYDAPGNLDRLRARALGPKRSLALRELALGIEALDRFVKREPLRRVHECVAGVLALESEPVDPRL